MVQGVPSKPVLSREEAARVEVGQTTVTPGTARALIAVFLAATVAVPVLEWAIARPGGAAGAWNRFAQVPAQASARLSGVAGASQDSGTWPRIISANREVLAGLSTFERALEDQSHLGRILRPPVQAWLSARLGAGNERVYVGRDGWLFYRPDVETLTGERFLSARRLASRVAAADEWMAPPQPDPRLAMRHFKLQLDRLGITLIVMPTPVKPTVHPERLSRLFGRQGSLRAPLHNPSYVELIAGLGREGILVFDPSQVLVDRHLKNREPQYLAADTHWRPEAVGAVAGALGSFIREYVSLAPVATPWYGTELREVTHEGDTLVMLDLPDGQTIYPAETVRIRRVLESDGRPWRPSRQADVLLLGDSFTNIYSLGTLGWGDAAGLAEQLSHVLDRPVDRLVQNDEGAFATRAMLARVAMTDPERLARTRVVVWQFAARELAFGDWRLIDLVP
jgi:alginate O-acetyltransferase complex protein AlgJ